MKILLAGFICVVLLAAIPLRAGTNLNLAPEAPETATNNPAETALDQLMAQDDAALAEVDQWIRDNDAQINKGLPGTPKDEFNARIRARLDGVQNNYENFLKRYPDYAPGHLAYGTFLEDIGSEDLAAGEFQTASKLDPKNPAAWNNLANYYGEAGDLTNAFIDYQKAIDLDSNEPVYCENLATTVYLFRKDAEKFYNINEAQVFDKSLALYQKAVQLDPTNFDLASDYAESYYGIKPLRTNDALIAWTNALKIAGNEIEREGVYIHLARIKLVAGRFNEVRAQLDAVTNSFYAELKNRLQHNLLVKENPQTNAVENSFATNAPENSTNTFAMSNAPAISTNEISTLTNVPPTPPALPPQTNAPPVNPTNLLNDMQLAPPAPRQMQ